VRDDVANALGRLARLGSDQELFVTAFVRPGGIEVVADLAERDVDRGRWVTGATIEATVTDAAGGSATSRGTIEPGRRSVLIRVAFAATEQKGPLRVRLAIVGGQGSVETRIDAEPTDTPLPGPPMLLRGAGPARSPMQPVAEPSFRRTERLRVQWPVAREAGQPTAQVLDRRGQPLGSPLPGTESESGGEHVVTFDLALGGLAPGDYVIQVTGARAEQHLVPFRVTR
jgi:hypothetical protein